MTCPLCHLPLDHPAPDHVRMTTRTFPKAGVFTQGSLDVDRLLGGFPAIESHYLVQCPQMPTLPGWVRAACGCGFSEPLLTQAAVISHVQTCGEAIRSPFAWHAAPHPPTLSGPYARGLAALPAEHQVGRLLFCALDLPQVYTLFARREGFVEVFQPFGDVGPFEQRPHWFVVNVDATLATPSRHRAHALELFPQADHARVAAWVSVAASLSRLLAAGRTAHDIASLGWMAAWDAPPAVTPSTDPPAWLAELATELPEP